MKHKRLRDVGVSAGWEIAYNIDKNLDLKWLYKEKHLLSFESPHHPSLKIIGTNPFLIRVRNFELRWFWILPRQEHSHTARTSPIRESGMSKTEAGGLTANRVVSALYHTN